MLYILSSELNTQWHLLFHDLQLIKLLWEMEQFHVEVKEEVKSIDTLLNVENILGSLRSGIYLLNLSEPSAQVMLLSS